MNDQISIAILQHEPVPNDLPAAVSRLTRAALDAASQGCALLVVPEASVTGYNIPRETMQQVALDARSGIAGEIASICVKHQIAICYGFAERADNRFYNSVRLVDKSGVALGQYRKTHLWGELDRTLFSAGEDLSPLVDLDGWKIGLLICYDIEFPECTRRLALEGAELILTPTGLMQPWREVAERVVPVRAYENQLYIAYANYCGTEGDLHYEGRSCVVGPDGTDLARAAQTPTLLTASLSRELISQTRADLPYHRDRRPELY